MKLVQFTYEGEPSEVRAGYVRGESVVDLNKADRSLPTTILEILRNGDLEKVQRIASTNPAGAPLASVRLSAPITGVDKVLCVGLNYRDHCREQNLTPPEVPIVFSKFASTIVGPNDALKIRTDVTQSVDWEVELALVIGRQASRVSAQEALDHVVGYTVAQDVSARDWQIEKNGGQVLLGKSMDTFCPLGPWIVTSDELGNPGNLDIKCHVNGVMKQSSNTKQLVHKIPDVIARLSSVMTLLPGDIILTGTPGGVGMHRQPAEWLQPGDLVRSEIQNMGVLTTRVEELVMTLLPGDIILTGTPGGVGMHRQPAEWLQPGDLVRSEIQNVGVLTTRVEEF